MEKKYKKYSLVIILITILILCVIVFINKKINEEYDYATNKMEFNYMSLAEYIFDCDLEIEYKEHQLFVTFIKGANTDEIIKFLNDKGIKLTFDDLQKYPTKVGVRIQKLCLEYEELHFFNTGMKIRDEMRQKGYVWKKREIKLNKENTYEKK